MCQILDISRGAYYRWLNTPVTKRDLEEIELTADIKRKIISKVSL
jgi:hypothetical protein